MLKYSCTILQYISHVQQKINILLYMIKKIKLISSHVRSKKSPLSLKEITFDFYHDRYLYWLIRKKYIRFFFFSIALLCHPALPLAACSETVGFFPPLCGFIFNNCITKAIEITSSTVLQLFTHTHARAHTLDYQVRVGVTADFSNAPCGFCHNQATLPEMKWRHRFAA